MITVHHLDNSRSQLVLWLMEELDLEYAIVFHKRQPIGLAPPELKEIHPLGKARAVDLITSVFLSRGGAPSCPAGDGYSRNLARSEAEEHYKHLRNARGHAGAGRRTRYGSQCGYGQGLVPVGHYGCVAAH